MRNDGATPIVERDETVLEAVEETISNVVNQIFEEKRGQRQK